MISNHDFHNLKNMHKKEKLIWFFSFVFTIACVFATAFIFKLKSETYFPYKDQLATKDDTNKFLTQYLKEYPEKPLFVPTGVFIESLDFKDSNTVHLSGYVWQKYSKNFSGEFTKGFILPESNDASIEKLYERLEDYQEIIGWYFEADIIQPFDYKEFPFDHKLVWLRILHKDFDKNIILVPDLVSYDSTLATDRFGLDKNIVLAGYEIQETYFKFDLSNYDTNFGIQNYVGKNDYPELLYNIVLKRNISDALVIYFLPLCAVFILLFFTILAITPMETLRKVTGFRLSEMMSLGALFLFIVILSHTQLKGVVIAESTMFIEYIYFTAYIAILWMVVISFVIANKGLENRFPLLFSYNSIVIKASFLPFASFLILLFSFSLI